MLEYFDMSFRLFKPNPYNVNFEQLNMMPLNYGEAQNTSVNEIGRTSQGTMYWKPIGYYTFNKKILTTNIEVNVPKETYKELELLKASNSLSTNIKIHQLSLEENAVIAAFSMEAYIYAIRFKDTSFIANGLDCDIFMTYDYEYPQVFLDDKYGLKGPIAAYKHKGGEIIDVVDKYLETFYRLNNMSLLTAFKNL